MLTVGAFAAGGIGLFTQTPGMLLLAVFGIAFEALASASPLPADDLAVERTVSDSSPSPGDDVTVTVTVRNGGTVVLPDVRIVDGVPPGLVVTEGSPRFTTALRRGRSASFSYTVTAVAGHHEFEPAVVLARDFSGAWEHRTSVDATTRITCERPTPSVSFDRRRQVTTQAGRTTTDLEGAGVEFHSVREYRRGDPVSRIDWRRRAKTGELTTVDFVTPRLATVLLVVDVRRSAYVAPADGSVPVVRRSVSAARALVDSLLDAGNPVGLASLGPDPTVIRPSRCEDHRHRLRTALSTGPAFDWTPPDDDVDATSVVRTVASHVDAGVQVVVLSPMLDRGAVSAVEHFEATGHRVTVVTLDPTSTTDLCGGFARLQREANIRALRATGATVVDWSRDDSVAEVLERGR